MRVTRFYFHVANGRTTLDEVGLDLPDLDAVRKEALGTTRDLMCEAQPHVWAGELCRVWVTDRPDAAAPPVFTLELSVREGPGQ